MNKKQKIISVIGVVLIFLSGLILPWRVITGESVSYIERPIGYYLIFLPPELEQDEPLEEEAEEDLLEEISYSIEVDVSRLIIQWVTILFVLAAALYLTKENEEYQELDD